MSAYQRSTCRHQMHDFFTDETTGHKLVSHISSGWGLTEIIWITLCAWWNQSFTFKPSLKTGEALFFRTFRNWDHDSEIKDRFLNIKKIWEIYLQRQPTLESIAVYHVPVKNGLKWKFVKWFSRIVEANWILQPFKL